MTEFNQFYYIVYLVQKLSSVSSLEMPFLLPFASSQKVWLVVGLPSGYRLNIKASAYRNT